MIRILYFICLILPFELFCKSVPDSLQSLDLQHSNLKMLPAGLSYKNIQALHLGYNPITQLPKELENARALKILSLNSVSNFNISEGINIIKKLPLEVLSLNNANLMFIPYELGQIKTLRHLAVSNNYIKEIPSFIFMYSDLQSLDVSNNIIGQLPKEIALQENLKSLNLNFNNCINESDTYNHLKKIRNLETLELKGASVLPENLWILRNLKQLNISNGTYDKVILIPDAIKNTLEYLEVNDCDLLDFSGIMPLLSSPLLKEVTLGGVKNNGLNAVNISSNLTTLHMNGQVLEHFTTTSIPANLSDITLHYTQITCEAELFSTLVKFQGLKTLNLANCNLTQLPAKLKELKNLETLNLSGNKLTNVSQLYALKQLAVLDVSLCGLNEQQIEKLKQELPETTIINNETYQKLALENVLPKAESFTISPAMPQTLVTKDGTEISIPKNSLVYSNGKTVKEPVTVSFTAYYSLAQIAASGINMKYESADVSAPFSSAGMFNINASANGQNLQIKKGSEINVNFKSTDPEESYNYYAYDSVKRNWTEFGKDSITKLKIKKEDEVETADSTLSSNSALGFAPSVNYPTPSGFYKYHSISIDWHLNHKKKPNGDFTISSIYEKDEVALDTNKNQNFFNELKVIDKIVWRIDAVKYANEIKRFYAEQKLFDNFGRIGNREGIFKSKTHTVRSLKEMDIEFELVADKTNDNFIFRFYNETDTVEIHAYPVINGKNPDRIQKEIKKIYFEYEAAAKERKRVAYIRKRKFEIAYKKYQENMEASRAMITQLNNRTMGYISSRSVVFDVPVARRLVRIMTLGVFNCDKPIIIEKPAIIKPEFYTTDGNEIASGVFQVVDPRYNITQSYYQPESISVAKRTILTFLYNSGTSNQVYIGKLNTSNISNRHGKVKITLSPLNKQVTEGQLAQAIKSEN